MEEIPALVFWIIMIEGNHPVKAFLVSSIDQIYVSKLGLNIQSRYLRHQNCWHRVCF